jgi:hypothetical protein
MTYKCVSNSKCGNPAVFGLGIKREGERERERERERDAIENGKEEIAEPKSQFSFRFLQQQ